jgi:hypothetical protein
VEPALESSAREIMPLAAGVDWGGDVRNVVVGVALLAGLALVGYRFPHWLTVAVVGALATLALLLPGLLDDHDEVPAVFALLFLPVPLFAVIGGALFRLWPRRGGAAPVDRTPRR